MRKPLDFNLNINLLQRIWQGFPGGASYKEHACMNAGDIRDTGSIPGSRQSPGVGKGNPLQYSCLENPMDREDWQATVHRVAKSRTCLKQASMQA